MKPDCQRYEGLSDAALSGPLAETDARFVAEHRASCAECSSLENALAAVALKSGDDAHFPVDDLKARRMVDAVLAAAPVFVEQPARRWPRVVLAIAALLAVVIGASFFFKPREAAGPAIAVAPTPTPSKRDPVVPVEPPKAPVEPARVLVAHVRSVLGADDLRSPGLTFAAGSTVTTKSSSLGFVLDESLAWLKARPGSELTFKRLEPKLVELELAAGHVEVHVPKGQGIAFSVRTPQGLVSVTGTVFLVDVAKKATRVAVAEGSVRCEFGSAQVTLGANKAMSSARPSVVSAASSPELASMSAALAEEHLVSGDSRGLLTVAPLARALGNAGEVGVNVDGVYLGNETVKLSLPVGLHLVTRKNAGSRRDKIAVEVGEKEIVVAERGAAGGGATPRSTPTPVTPRVTAGGGSESVAAPPIQPLGETTDSLMKAAQAARAQRDWNGAATAYGAIIERHDSTPAAEVARLSLGQLQVDQLGAPRQGRELCASYVERNPSGSLVAEAELCQIRAFATLGDVASETRAIDAFLKRWPNDFNVARLVRRREALAPAK